MGQLTSGGKAAQWLGVPFAAPPVRHCDAMGRCVACAAAPLSRERVSWCTLRAMCHDDDATHTGWQLAVAPTPGRGILVWHPQRHHLLAQLRPTCVRAIWHHVRGLLVHVPPAAAL